MSLASASLTREIFGNIDGLSKIVFYALAVLALVVFTSGVWSRVRIWRLRLRNEQLNWRVIGWRLWAKAFLQRKVREGPRKWGAGLAHAALFFGFVVLFIGTCLVALEEYGQILAGREGTNPLFHKGLYYAIFELTLDVGGLGLIGGCLYFIWRRIKATSSMEHRLADWVVVGSLLYLGVSGYVVEGARILLEDSPEAWVSPVGWGVSKILLGLGLDGASMPLFHRVNWWVHAVAALGFIAAIPYCRLLHLFAGTVNIGLRDYEMGAMEPVSFEDVESKGYIGVKSLNDLEGTQLLALDACVSCGRCEDACPAFLAGKPLSPRNVVQDIRREMDNAGLAALAFGAEEGPTLPGEVVRAETLWACTTCNACVAACPVEVAPLEFITDLRRYLIGEGTLRGTPAVSLQKMQRVGNPWGMPARERFDWAEGLGVPTVQDNPDFEVLYWVGCAASYDPRARKVARATAQLLQAAKVNFACLGAEEKCTGDSARRMGDEFLFQELAEANVASLNRYGVKQIVTHCPHCLNALKKDYGRFGGSYTVKHHSQFLQELLETGSLQLNGEKSGKRVTYHDPCYLSRVQGIIDQPRSILGASLEDGASALTEMKRNGCATGCCGGGGGRMWFDDHPGERTGVDRVEEVTATEADIVAVSCPFCLTMMKDGLAAKASSIVVKDVAELMAEALQS